MLTFCQNLCCLKIYKNTYSRPDDWVCVKSVFHLANLFARTEESRNGSYLFAANSCFRFAPREKIRLVENERHLTLSFSVMAWLSFKVMYNSQTKMQKFSHSVSRHQSFGSSLAVECFTHRTLNIQGFSTTYLDLV